MPLLTKRQLLRRAHQLMNSNGLHWLQGDFFGYKWIEEKQKEVEGFCTLGALQKVLFGDPEHSPSDYDDPVEFALFQEATFDLARAIRARHPDRYSGYSGEDADLVVSWNDDPSTTWEDVNAVFTAVALEKAKRATPSAPIPLV